MKRLFSLLWDGPPEVRLRAIAPDDLEDLRVWKNAYREAFFFKDEIPPPMQERWFQSYLARPQDHMFLVESGGLRAGCMGFRIQGDAADCYNIIGTPAAAGRGIMSAAMRVMCSHILAEHTRDIGLRVLKNNPAATWYQARCCYRIAKDGPDYHQLQLDLERFQPCRYEKKEVLGP